MKVLIIGSGGREHALAYAISRDPEVEEVHCAPGNPGIELTADLHPLADITDGDEVAGLAQQLGVDLVIIGPEGPLVAGVADAVRAAGIDCFGPSKDAAQIEGSKSFAKEVMAAAGVPTAKSRTCSNLDEVKAAMEEFGTPYVIKDDGLAQGKGVIVTSDATAALDHAEKCKGTVVVEEYLKGPEVSLFCITDGKRVAPFQPAQDFKRVGDGDTGPNTGGMGAYTPLPWAPANLTQDVVDTIVQPTLDELAKRGTPFQGLLYVGLALTAEGPKVIEFNARFGDPETQALMVQLESPLAQVLQAAAKGDLSEWTELKFFPGASVCVVLATEGYPDKPQIGSIIKEGQFRSGSTKIFHAGTARDAKGQLVTAGGRAMNCVARGSSLKFARNMVYAQLRSFWVSNLFWRHDIAEAAVMGQVHIPERGE